MNAAVLSASALNAETWRALGVYVRTADAIPDTILATSFNSAYKPLYELWSCRADLMGYKYLVWLQDNMQLRDTRHATFYNVPHVSGDPVISAREATFGQTSFNAMASIKLDMVLNLLRQGVQRVWFSDVDVYFVQAPWPFVQHNCEYVYQRNTVSGFTAAGLYEANIGFHVVRNTPRMRMLLRTAHGACRREAHLTAQKSFWTAVNKSSAGAVRSWCPLDMGQFAPGNMRPDAKTNVVYHANYRLGLHAKLSFLRATFGRCHRVND